MLLLKEFGIYNTRVNWIQKSYVFLSYNWDEHWEAIIWLWKLYNWLTINWIDWGLHFNLPKQDFLFIYILLLVFFVSHGFQKLTDFDII